MGEQPVIGPPDAPAGEPPEEGSARPRRGRETAGDMVRSLAVVLALVIVVLALTLRHNPPGKPHRVDYRGVLAQARNVAPYDLVSPVGLPRSWTATSARASEGDASFAWHLGLVSPDGDYAAVEQSDGDPQSFVTGFVGHGSKAGTATIHGQRWRRIDSGHPEKRALVLDGDAVTTVVTGGASWTELRRLAASLQG
ncbi:MAG TPA: DUF4245 domain-containing protein [Actinomycetes bacterium]|jgi:hypothetical protein|nr:DUF4245 domain-containing protein [Actinomycetes bacterium]